MVPQADLVQTADNDNSCAMSESGALGTTIWPVPACNELTDAPAQTPRCSLHGQQ